MALAADSLPLKKLPGGRNRSLFVCSFLFCLSTTMLSFSLIYLLKDRFGFGAGGIGSSIALGSVFYFFGCYLYQWFGSRIPGWRVLPVAAGCCLLFSLLLGLTKSGGLAVAAWGAVQLSTGFFWPPLQAWFTRGLGEAELNRDIGWFNRSWMTGSFLGPLAGGTLYHLSRFLALAAPLAGLLGTFLILLFLAVKEAGGGEREKEEKRENRRRPGRAGRDMEKSLVFFKVQSWAGSVCANLFSGVLANIVPLYIRDTLGSTEKTAGMVLLFRGLAAIIAFTLYSRFAFWHFNQRWILLLQALLILLALLFLLGNGLVVFYMVIAFGFGLIYAGCYNNSLFHSGADKKNTAKNMAFHEIFLSIGAAAGSLGGGLCFQYLGMGGTFLILALVQAAGLGFLVLLNSRFRRGRG
jgi:predicted MFS family arabinose efflux permease